MTGKPERGLRGDPVEGIGQGGAAARENVHSVPAEGEPSEPSHSYTGNPRHCLDCALRSFANAELRARHAEARADAAERLVGKWRQWARTRNPHADVRPDEAAAAVSACADELETALAQAEARPPSGKE